MRVAKKRAWLLVLRRELKRMVSYFFPSTFGVQAFIRMNTAGASAAAVQVQLMALWVQAGIYFVLSWFVYRWQILQSEKRSVRG